MSASTWHHGVVARWWAEFKDSGPEIDYFRRVRLKQVSQRLTSHAALGVCCFRTSEPVSTSTVATSPWTCSRSVARPLRAKASHRSSTRRRCTSSICRVATGRSSSAVDSASGAAGNRIAWRSDASTNTSSLVAYLLLDNEVPYADATMWQYWLKEKRAELPGPRKPAGTRRSAKDGAEYELRSRLVGFDPLAQRATLEMRALMWRDGELVADEEHVLTMMLYFKDELVLMLERAGFAGVRVCGPYNDAEPTPGDDFLVFIAQRAA